MRFLGTLAIVATMAGLSLVSAAAAFGKNVRVLGDAEIIDSSDIPGFNTSSVRGIRNIVIDGIPTVVDLSGPDVTTHPNGIISKPLVPGASFHVDAQPRPKDGLLAARTDPNCSVYFTCSGSYVVIPVGFELWSDITIHGPNGAANDGNYGLEINSGSYIAIAKDNAIAFSHNTIDVGCLMRVDAPGCTFEIHGALGSFNTLSAH